MRIKKAKSQQLLPFSTDVAIIGAGVSGLYAGYRFLTGDYQEGKQAPQSISVFEMSNRIGGRLESIELDSMNVMGELGGMRYMTSQEIVTALIEDIFKGKITPVEFPMGDPANLLNYLRKQRFLNNSWRDSTGGSPTFETRYFVKEQFIGYSSDYVFNWIVNNVLKAGGYDKSGSEYTAREWDDIKKILRYNFEGPYNGMLVKDMGFWNLIKDQTDEETYQFLSDAGGYYSNTINWNAAEAFPYMVGDFAQQGVQYKTIKEGYDQIAYCLAEEFTKLGGVIYQETKLKSFERTPAGSQYKYVMTIENTRTKVSMSIYANHIFLAMPRKSLELIDQNNFFFNNPVLKKNIPSVIMEPSFKLLLGFEYPWWTNPQILGATSGHSVTDLPMRQCYYFGTDPENKHSLFLSSYNDMRTVQFWKALQSDKLFQPRATKLVTLKSLQKAPYKQAPKEMVDEAMKQIRELHGHPELIPEPYTSAYKDWSGNPYGGGYHAWKAKYDVWNVMPFMRKPSQNDNIYICGEAYSDQQGWVEGAFCVTEHIMQDYFGLLWPSWLNKEYYLGW